MIYKMQLEEVEELNLLKKELLHINGIPKTMSKKKFLRKVVRLKYLLNKKQELRLASLN